MNLALFITANRAQQIREASDIVQGCQKQEERRGTAGGVCQP